MSGPDHRTESFMSNLRFGEIYYAARGGVYDAKSGANNPSRTFDRQDAQNLVCFEL